MTRSSHSENFFLEICLLETDFNTDSESSQSACDEQLPVLRGTDHKDQLLEHYLLYQTKELTINIEKIELEYSEITDNEMILLIDKLVDARDAYSQHKFDASKTQENFYVTMKSLVELERQRPSNVPFLLKTKLEKLLTQT